MAKIYFRYGAMSSGKTRDLMKVYYNYKERDMHALIIKPAVDTKGEGQLSARDGSFLDTELLLKKDDNVFEIIDDKIKSLKEKVHCILVDEAQFLEVHQVDELTDVADILGIPIICYGLRADFKTDLFPGSKRLLEVADSIEEVKTVCFCGRKAIMNTRKINGEYVFEGEQVAIDGKDKVTYNSLCRICYKIEKSKYNKKHNIK